MSQLLYNWLDITAPFHPGLANVHPIKPRCANQTRPSHVWSIVLDLFILLLCNTQSCQLFEIQRWFVASPCCARRSRYCTANTADIRWRGSGQGCARRIAFVDGGSHAQCVRVSSSGYTSPIKLISLICNIYVVSNWISLCSPSRIPWSVTAEFFSLISKLSTKIKAICWL